MLREAFTILLCGVLNFGGCAQQLSKPVRLYDMSELGPDVGGAGYSAVLELMDSVAVFVLKEIAGVFPLVFTNIDGQQLCVWNDRVNIANPTILPKNTAGQCRVYRFGNQIGLGVVDQNDKMVEGTAVNSWRPLPYLDKH